MVERNPATTIIGKEILPFEVGYLPEFFEKKAAAELNESQELKTEKMNELKKLLREDKHSKSLIFIDEFLLMFLRVRKYNAEKAFHQIKSYIVVRKKNPNMFIDLRFDSIVKTIDNEIIYMLPWRCQNGCAILVIQIENWDPDKFSVEEVKRSIVTYLLSSLRDPMTQVNGIKIIIDVKCNPIKYLKHATPNNLHLIYHAAQNICPIRYKEVHIINDSVLFRTAYAVIKHFLTEKIRRRLIFHEDSKSLLNYFPRSVLPKHYGGDLEKYDMTDWLKRSMVPEKIATIGGVTNWPSKK
ncbi:unnamed protein product [Larinioides sclopetarius]|uniref:CRAL-TRIO domain-containing protein n=1 Tax=Larinioides sclopetarius TaxID=280406 RepID=A0AAV1ZR05_9ARAC